MIWTCKTLIAGMVIAALALMVTIQPGPAYAQKKTGAATDPKAKYEQSLDVALHRLKDAERAVIQSDLRELNLAQFNPVVFQKLTAAAQAVNHAYMLTQQAKAMSVTIVPPQGGAQPGAAPKKKNSK